MTKTNKPRGCVYLIHFERRFGHAQHYRGYCSDRTPKKRIENHRKGSGARIMQVVNDAGISWVVARVWKNKTRKFERSLKSKKVSDICPICKSVELLESLEKDNGCVQEVVGKEFSPHAN